MMKLTNLFALCMVMIIVSMLGFWVENIWLAMTKGYMDNRNMCFPFLIGYGIAMLLILLIIGTPKKMWILGKTLWIQNKMLRILVYFLAVMLCICVGEVLLGTFVEKVCHFCWWDYSRLPLHITQYTSIPTSMMFASMVTLFMQHCLEPLFHFFVKWDYDVLRTVTIVLMGIMIGDFLYNAHLMYKTRGMVRRWKVDMSGNRVYKRLHT
ncbi:MAG: putative ABC transporter permease [Lachnospiraceae bacterium]|nr:putative ABC transporter permease [Lachnospiraceae bacterium]MEE1256589.1 putative ABC transporter permease [Lachnospiraceae bacterium]